MSLDNAQLAGPAWDLSEEYKGVGTPDFERDLEVVTKLTAELEAVSAKVAPLVPRATALTPAEASAALPWSQEASRLYQEASKLLYNVEVFLSCELSVDAKNGAAKTLAGKTRQMGARLEQANNAVHQFLKLTDDAFVEKYLAAPHTAPERFLWKQERKLRDQALSVAEEDLTIALDVDGPSAWGTLYDNLSGAIVCSVELPADKGGTKKMGLAEAATLLQTPSEAERQAAFKAIGCAWEANEEPAAAILNALAGWRHTMYRRRSHTKPVHFLDAPLHSCRITRATLDAMMTAVKEGRPQGQRVLKLIAKVLGKETCAPWDLFAPCPVKGGSWTPPSFDRAIDIISESYGGVSAKMGSFVRMMAERRWIEGRVGGAKRPGAYCTGFAKSRTPRVYMTYAGGMRELKTLAHELGHAFHSWVMRDMPLPETYYPMTLAETASIFGEAVVNGALLERATHAADRLAFTWAQAREVESLLLNIPARFTFEKAFYEKRLESTLNPADFKKLMVDSWREWYGDALTEMDPMFWASKLHFSIAGLSFYNFPYTFGYLFSLGVYAQRERLGAGFFDAYVALLRDTGRMTAEELAMKHLNADLTKPDFWRQSVAIAKRSVDDFDAAVKDFAAGGGRTS
jgi:oligoendopeptidase F